MCEFEIENGKLKKYNGDGGRVVVPEGVTVIGFRAFDSEDRRIEEVILPKSLKTIDMMAFYGSSVVSVMIPEGVTEIGEQAFFLCFQLERAVIPRSVKTIGELAFANCHRLRECAIPEGVMRMGRGVFWSCESLTEAVIPASVTEMGAHIFANCRGLKRAVVSDGAGFIGEECFMNCRALTEAVIPSSVRVIGRKAFNSCRSLREVRIPEGVETIGELAFNYCTAIEVLTVPDSVKKIDGTAFDNISATARLRIGYEHMKLFEGKRNLNVRMAALRGFLYRYAFETVDDEELDFWKEFTVHYTAEIGRTLVNEPLLYRFLAESGRLGESEAGIMLKQTESAECRAILLDFLNEKREEKTEGGIDERFGIE